MYTCLFQSKHKTTERKPINTQFSFKNRRYISFFHEIDMSVYNIQGLTFFFQQVGVPVNTLKYVLHPFDIWSRHLFQNIIVACDWKYEPYLILTTVFLRVTLKFTKTLPPKRHILEYLFILFYTVIELCFMHTHIKQQHGIFSRLHLCCPSFWEQ